MTRQWKRLFAEAGRRGRNRGEEMPAMTGGGARSGGGSVYGRTKAILEDRTDPLVSTGNRAARYLTDNARVLFWDDLGDMPMGHEWYSVLFLTRDGDLLEVITDSAPGSILDISRLTPVPYEQLPEMIARAGGKAARFAALTRDNYRDYL